MSEPTGPGQPDETDSQSLELLAAALRADAADVAALTRVLTASLGDTLPAGMVEVERDRSLADRLAGRDGTAVAVRVTVPEQVLELRAGRRGPEAEVRKVVHGVVISRRQIGVEQWLKVLAGELTRVAAHDAAARAALAALLGG